MKQQCRPPLTPGILALALFATAGAQAEPQRYNGAGNGFDRALAIAVDSGGYVYVTGYQWGGPSTGQDILTLKYASSGALLWARVYNGPVSGQDWGSAVAVDAAGNVCVTGLSDGDEGHDKDYVTLKYAPNGVLLWEQRYDGPGHGLDYPTGMAVDGAGNVCVTGVSPGAASDQDFATLKYAPDGDLLWAHRYNGPANGRDRPYDLAVDAAGQVYVTGVTGDGPLQGDYATIKYAPNGVPIWIRHYDGPAGGRDTARALTVDGAGNVLVTGDAPGLVGWGDYATLKYAPGGVLLWVSRYTSPANGANCPLDLAVDAAGNIYVTGYSWGPATGDDFATIKYAPNGVAIWARRYDGPGNGTDRAHTLRFDAAGNICITGGSWGGATGWDYATIKYSPNGVVLWVRRYHGPVDSDSARALATDAAGNLYVTGVSEGLGTGEDFLTLKYALNGAPLW